MTPRTFALTLVFGFIRLAPLGAFGKDVTLFLSAKVESVDDRAHLLGGAVAPGDTITGCYTYNPNAADENDFPGVSDYRHGTRPYGINLKAGHYYFRTNPDSVDFLIELVNDHYSGNDNYLLRSYHNISEPALPLGYVDHIAWQLDDTTMKALSSDRLTAEPPVLADWKSVFGLTIDGCDGKSGHYGCGGGNSFFIRAHVFEVSIQPRDFDPLLAPAGIRTVVRAGAATAARGKAFDPIGRLREAQAARGFYYLRPEAHPR
jgi:hypothetical protein